MLYASPRSPSQEQRIRLKTPSIDDESFPKNLAVSFNSSGEGRGIERAAPRPAESKYWQNISVSSIDLASPHRSQILRDF
jgi:hypothetical protein